MSVVDHNSKPCEPMRRNLDAYLSNELGRDAMNDLQRHLEGCPACSQELAARTRVRDALRRVVGSAIPPEPLRRSIRFELRERQAGFGVGSLRPRWVVALAGAMCIILGVATTQQWLKVRRERQIVASVLALGVADHLQCAIKGHNYPDLANPPGQLRQKLGPEYAGLLEVVREKLPGFEILEAHICSVAGSPRKYVHFIVRGRGTILSVILTRSGEEQLPSGMGFRPATAGSVNLYEAQLQGMNAVGFASREYWGFVVSDLSRDTTLQIASELAPPLKAALDASQGTEALLMLHLCPLTTPPQS